MKTMVRSGAVLTGMLLLWMLSVKSLRIGLYGWTIFVVFPALLGGLSALLFRPTTALRAAGTGALSNVAAALLLLLVGKEGFLCIVMALPILAPFGALGGFLVYHARTSRVASRGATMLLLLPIATFTWDIKAKPPVFAVRTQLEVAAPAELVWKNVIAASTLPEPREWFFRAGVGYPKSAHIDGSGLAATRYCDFSTGSLVEPVEVWEEPRLLRFRVTANPPPLREWSPYGDIDTRHLHGYLISKQGEFKLTPLANGHTLLTATTLYQHGLWPAEYWRWWSDAIIHRIHLRVLDHVRSLAESEVSSASAGK